jgi:hypothetical protein
MAAQKPFVLGPVEDRWGTWVIGSVPLLDLGGTQGVVHVGIDISAADWSAQLHRTRTPLLVISAAASAKGAKSDFTAETTVIPTGLTEAELLALLDEAEASTPHAASPKIVKLFLEETPRRFDAMHAALTAADVAAFAREAHSLKSTSCYADAAGLARLGERALLTKPLEVGKIAALHNGAASETPPA